jgi:hypothetical protein
MEYTRLKKNINRLLYGVIKTDKRRDENIGGYLKRTVFIRAAGTEVVTVM